MIMTQPLLKQKRIEAGITASELLREARVSRPTLQNAEKGINVTTISASRIVNAFNKLARTEYTPEELGIHIQD